jgi:hypothetical protein
MKYRLVEVLNASQAPSFHIPTKEREMCIVTVVNSRLLIYLRAFNFRSPQVTKEEPLLTTIAKELFQR